MSDIINRVSDTPLTDAALAPSDGGDKMDVITQCRQFERANAALLAALRNLYKRGENYATIRETADLLDKYEEPKKHD